MARKSKDIFHFKEFSIRHDRCAHKVGTDGVLLGAWVDVDNTKRILDVGTGSGVIALMLAQRTPPDTHIDAIDISSADCEQAQENVGNSPWPEKVSIKNTSFQELDAEPYDLIISNPPYFIHSAKPSVEGRVRARHAEESLPPQELLRHTKRLLDPKGKLCLILPVTEAQSFIAQSQLSGMHCTRLCDFRSRSGKPVERLLIQLHLHSFETQKEELVLYDYEEVWTTDYKNLTRDFYLNR